jgi:hypothetical protein
MVAPKHSGATCSGFSPVAEQVATKCHCICNWYNIRPFLFKKKQILKYYTLFIMIGILTIEITIEPMCIAL